MLLRKMTWSALAFSLVLSVACKSTGGAPAAPPGPSDEELITQVLNDSVTALQGKDVTGMMQYYAEDFASDQGDKAGMQAFLQQAADAGFLDGMKTDSTNLVVTVDGDTAAASGVNVEGAFGVLNLSFKLAKRAGNWIIVGQSQE